MEANVVSSIFYVFYAVVTLYATLFVGVVMHEFGHWVGARVFSRISPSAIVIGRGLKFDLKILSSAVSIRLIPYGGITYYAGELGQRSVPNGSVSWEAASHAERAAAAVSGPVAHIVLFVLPIWFTQYVSCNNYWIAWFQICCIAQITLAIVSLIPGRVSDGGHIYRSLRSKDADWDGDVMFSCWVRVPLLALVCGAALQAFCAAASAVKPFCDS